MADINSGVEIEIAELKKENAGLKSELEKVRDKLHAREQEGFLIELVGNNRITEEEFFAACKEYDVFFPTDRFLVMAIQRDEDQGPDTTTQEDLRHERFLIRNVLEELLNRKNYGRVIIVRGMQIAVVSVALEDEDGVAAVEESAQVAAEVFEAQYGAILYFTISRVHRGFDAIPRAYQEAQTLVQYRTMAGDETRVLRYDRQTEQYVRKERVEHFEFEHELGNLLRSGDYDGARGLVHRMLQMEFNHARPTIQIYMVRAYGLINDILHVFDSMEEDLSSDVLVELQAGPRIMEAQSLQEIMQEMDAIIDAIMAKQQTLGTEPLWLQRAVDYIDENYTDPNLNVSSVADAIGINPVYLSRMLKKYRKIRPLEYIHEKRIAQAKKLLGQGVPVKDTIPLVGYSSALTMNRAFRKFENTTPGAFFRDGGGGERGAAPGPSGSEQGNNVQE